MGTILQRFGRDLPVVTGTPVTAIRHTAVGVTVETEAGAVAAGAAIVPVSTSVLAAEAILFDPPPSEDKRAALAAIPPGRANKLAPAVYGHRKSAVSGKRGSGRGVLGGR